jgi:RNA polymerase sigma-70 factor (ECF subfamily)
MRQEGPMRAGNTNDVLDRSWEQTLRQLRGFVAARVGGDQDLAADITQDVVVRSIASGALARVDNPAAWLYRSARNAVIDHYRTRRAQEPADVLEGWPDPEAFDEGRPNDATRELARCLGPLLGELPVSAREALTRVDLEGQTQQAAAADAGISVSGMKSRVQRGRRQLRELLERCCQVDVDRTGAVAAYRPAGDGDGDGCGCGGPSVPATGQRGC